MGLETNAKIVYARCHRELPEMDSKDTNDSYRPIFDDSRKTRWLSISMRTEHHPFGQPIYSYRHLSTDVGAIDFIFEKSSGCIFAKELRAGCIIIFKTDA